MPRLSSGFRKAAEQGDAGAQNNLGAMYANGQGGLAPWGETNSLDTVDRSLVFDGQRRPFAA